MATIGFPSAGRWSNRENTVKYPTSKTYYITTTKQSSTRSWCVYILRNILYMRCLVFIIIFKYGGIRIKVIRRISIGRYLCQHHTSCIDGTFVRLPTDNPTEYQYDATHNQTHLELSKFVDTLQPAWTIIWFWIYDLFCLFFPLLVYHARVCLHQNQCS